MGRAIAAIIVAVLGAGIAAAQETPSAPDALATVRIAQSVLAGGKPLPQGTYELRFADERLSPPPSAAQRRVEFVANGRVVASDVAEVLRDDDRPEVGASSRRGPSGTRVDTLKGNEFLRISVTRGSVQYLVYLPIVP